MTDEINPQNKTDLLNRMAEGRTALEQALSRLSEAQLTANDANSGWSIKDHLAHLAAWEAGIAALLQHQSRWTAMGLDEAAVANHETDEMNNIIHAQQQGRSLAEVQAYFQESHRQMLAALAGLSDEELFKPYRYYEASEADAEDQRPIINWIIGNTYEHYDEHQGWIEAQL